MSLVAAQQIKDGNGIATFSQAITGGTIYSTVVENGGVAAPAISSIFVPNGLPSNGRFLKLTDAKSDAGVSLTATATGGAVGVARTAGASLQLAGEATSSSAVTDKAFFEFNLPDTYIAGANIPVTVNAVVTGSGTLTAPSTTMTVAAYTEINGVEAALTVSAAVAIPKTTAANLAFTVTGTGLVPGQHVAIELAMLVTSASGANTGYINSVSYSA